MQCVASLIQISPAFVGCVARHLLHPGLVRGPRHPGEADAPTLQVNEEQHVVGNQTAPGEDLDSEEVDTGQNCHVGSNELLPGRVLAAFRRWRDAMALQNVADGLIRYAIPEI